MGFTFLPCYAQVYYLSSKFMNDEQIYLKCEQLLAAYTKEYKYDEQIMRTIQIEIGSDAFLKMLLERDGKRIRTKSTLKQPLNDPPIIWEYVTGK